LTGIAALLVALAVLMLIAYNWTAMPAALKLAIIFAVLIGTYVAAFAVRDRWQRPIMAEVVFCLAGLFYGAAIFLIAQIFHVNAHSPTLVWWWAVGVLPFALGLESVLLHVLVASLLAIWSGMEVFGWGNLGAWFLGRWDFIPNGAYTLPLLALPGMVWAYRRRSLPAVWIYVSLLAWWAVLQPFAWRLEEPSLFFIGMVAGVMLLIAGSHYRFNDLASPHRELGTLLMLGTLLILSFHEVSEEIFSRGQRWQRVDAAGAKVGPWVITVAAWLIALAMLRWSSRLSRDVPLVPAAAGNPMLFAVRRQWLPLGLMSLMTLLLGWWAVGLGPLIPTVLANVAMIAAGFWLLHTGLEEDSGRTFAAGVIYLLIWAVVRYVDMFGDFGGMLGAALVFFLCGIALFGVAWYWRHRKERFVG
jgi:uncharacterized membrane protein